MENHENKSKKMFMLTAGVAAVLAVFLLGRLFIGGNKVQIKNFIQYQVEGMDENGVIRVFLDVPGIVEEIEKKTALTERERADLEELLWDSTQDLAVSKREGLSNGDKVKITTKINNDTFKPYKISFKNGTLTVKVKDLLPIHKLSLEDYLVCGAYGYSGTGYAKPGLDQEKMAADIREIFEKDGRGAYGILQEGTDLAQEVSNAVELIESCWKNHFLTEVDQSEGLSNQDKVKVKCTWREDTGDPYVIGFELEEGSRKCTIEGLREPEDIKEQIQKYMTDMEPQLKNEAIKYSIEFCDGREDYVWFMWNQSETVLESYELVYLPKKEEEILYMTYHMAVPLRHMDRSVTQEDLYYTVCLKEIGGSADGQDGYDGAWSGELHSTREEAEAYVEEDLAKKETPQILIREESEELPVISCENGREVSGEEPVPDDGQESHVLNVEGGAASVSLDGHTYVRFDTNITWKEAKEACEKAGGHLAVVTSEREQAAITWLCKDAPREGYSTNRYWLGASDESWEGDWKWVTGEDVSWSYWWESEPDNNALYDYNSDYLIYAVEEYHEYWCDGSENETGGYVLEMEPVDADKDPEKDSERICLTDLKPYDSCNSGVKKGLTDSYGNTYIYSRYLNAGKRGSVVYDLNGEWTKLTGILSTWDKASGDDIFEFGIWGDGQLLFSKYNYRKEDGPVPFCIDVKGVEKLFIQSRSYGDGDKSYLFLNNTKLSADGTETVLTESENTISDLQLITSLGYENKNGSGLRKDLYGQEHRDCCVFDADHSSYAVWNLGGNYTSFDAVIGAGLKDGAYSAQTSGTVEILLDGEIVYQEEQYDVFQDYLDISLDLTGRRTLEIRMDCDPEGAPMRFYLTDCILKRPVPEKINTEIPEPVFPEIDEKIEALAARIMTGGNYRYYLFEEEVTWPQAAEFCQKAGGTLACPTNADKNAVLLRLMSKAQQNWYWIGGSQKGDSWEWMNGDTYGQYVNWFYKDRGPYLGIEPYNGEWKNRKETAVSGFIMEVEAVSQQNPDNELKMTDFEWMDSQEVQPATLKVDGACYLESARFNASGNGRFTVDLDRKCTVFSGKTYLAAEGSDDVNLQFAVFGDGKLLYEQRNIRKNTENTGFCIDVTGIKLLTVSTSNLSGDEEEILYLRGSFRVDGATKEGERVSRLSDLVQVDAHDISADANLFLDTCGALHDKKLDLNAGKGARVLYNLAGEYSIFSGTVAAGNGTERGRYITLRISADGEVLQEITGFDVLSDSVHFELDITGKKTLEILAECEENTRIYLADDRIS